VKTHQLFRPHPICMLKSMDSLLPGGLEKRHTQREKVAFYHTIKAANVRSLLSKD